MVVEEWWLRWCWSGGAGVVVEVVLEWWLRWCWSGS